LGKKSGGRSPPYEEQALGAEDSVMISRHGRDLTNGCPS
jgi:hypothetical protein